MTDIACFWNGTSGDLSVLNNDLQTDDGLRSEVVRALFSDARASSADRLPDGQTGRRGWWGDDFNDVPQDKYGSKLWLLEREKQTEETRGRAVAYAAEALEHLIEDGVTDRIDVEAEWIDRGVLAFAVDIYRPKTDIVEYRFNLTWAAEDARFAAATTVRGVVDHIEPESYSVVTDEGDTIVTDEGDTIIFGDPS